MPSLILVKVTEKIAIGSNGLANCVRVFEYSNNSNTDIALNTLPAFEARFPPSAWDLKVKENYISSSSGMVTSTRDLKLLPVDFGNLEAKWMLERPTLPAKDTYSFSLSWELRSFASNFSSNHTIYYEHAEEQTTSYELIIQLPQKKELLDQENLSDLPRLLRRLTLRLWRIEHSTNREVERTEESGIVSLRYTDQISKNHPLRVRVIYSLKLPGWISFAFGFVVGILGNLAASYIWDLFLKDIFK